MGTNYDPHHAWQYDGETGVCAKIPYCDQIPKKALVRPWEVRERNGFVFVWYHARQEPSSWEVPVLEEVGDPFDVGAGRAKGRAKGTPSGPPRPALRRRRQLTTRTVVPVLTSRRVKLASSGSEEAQKRVGSTAEHRAAAPQGATRRAATRPLCAPPSRSTRGQHGSASGATRTAAPAEQRILASS